MKKSSLNYLKESKKQPASRWTEADQNKFYDAIKIFGENCSMIHHYLFSPKTALRNYKDPEADFKERSIIQLKNKLKKDSKAIEEHLKTKQADEGIKWLEAKYNINISKAMNKDDSESESEEEEDEEYGDAYDESISKPVQSENYGDIVEGSINDN